MIKPTFPENTFLKENEQPKPPQLSCGIDTYKALKSVFTIDSNGNIKEFERHGPLLNFYYIIKFNFRLLILKIKNLRKK